MVPVRLKLVAVLSLSLGLACQRSATHAVFDDAVLPSASPAAPPDRSPGAFRCRSDDACHPLRCDLTTGDCRNPLTCTDHSQCLPGWLCTQGGGDMGEAMGFVFRCQHARCEADALDDALRQRAPIHEAVWLDVGFAGSTVFYAPNLTVCPNDYDRFRVAAPSAGRVTLRVEPDLGAGFVDLTLLVLSPVTAAPEAPCTTQSRTGHEVVLVFPRDACLLHEGADGDGDAAGTKAKVEGGVASTIRFVEFYVRRAEGVDVAAEGRYDLSVGVGL